MSATAHGSSERHKTIRRKDLGWPATSWCAWRWWLPIKDVDALVSIRLRESAHRLRLHKMAPQVTAMTLLNQRSVIDGNPIRDTIAIAALGVIPLPLKDLGRPLSNVGAQARRATDEAQADRGEDTLRLHSSSRVTPPITGENNDSPSFIDHPLQILQKGLLEDPQTPRNKYAIDVEEDDLHAPVASLVTGEELVY